MKTPPIELVRIPTKFFMDHHDRALPTPEIQHMTKHHYWIHACDPAFPALISDAHYYADRWGPDGCPQLVTAARALLAAIQKQQPLANPHAVALGRKGGRVMSDAKAAAARANGKKGGRPKKNRSGSVMR